MAASLFGLGHAHSPCLLLCLWVLALGDSHGVEVNQMGRVNKPELFPSRAPTTQPQTGKLQTTDHSGAGPQFPVCEMCGLDGI